MECCTLPGTQGLPTGAMSRKDPYNVITGKKFFSSTYK
jgi:hypothetical protein